MSISVKNISKVYGNQYALNNVSFEIGTGEIVGFLGPNGAGKSTMMKILTCYLPPTEGKAEICGIDVMEDAIQVKKHVGYLPEHNPLYLDMYVKEYLAFIAGLHHIKNAKQRIDEMIQIVGLGIEKHKKIGALSKGYRQRVGLAQALIHDPSVLIMDEPTTGLDPNQLEEIRNLIKEIGKQKTVMLSTHIMQEVEAICSRVIIIDKGIIKADDKTDALQTHSNNKQVVYVEFDKEIHANKLTSIPGVSKVKHVQNFEWIIESKSSNDIRPQISKFAIENRLLVLTIRKEEQSLEETFKKLTANK